MLVCLATHRLTRLLVTDEITTPAREALQNRAEARWATGTGRTPPADEWGSRIAYLLSCPWCASVWVAAAVVAALAAAGHAPAHPLLLTLAASTVTGLLTGLEES